MIFRRQYLPIVSTISIGIIVSLLMFRVVHNWEEKDQMVEFESRSRGCANAIQQELNATLEALWTLKDFFDQSEQITRDDFSGFVNSLLARHPSIQGFSWNPLVKNHERADYELLAQKEGFENFQFSERSEENTLVRAGQRQEYVVVYYIVPLEPNKAALGYDIASDQTRLQAINKAFDTGKLSVTDKITLVQETGKQAGVLVLLPLYQKGVNPETQEERYKYRKGFLVEVLRIGDVVHNAMNKFSDAGIDLYLYDLSAEEEQQILYPHPEKLTLEINSPANSEAVKSGFYLTKNFDIGGRQWRMSFWPSSSYDYSHNLFHAWVALFASLFFTFALAFYLLKKINYTNEIERGKQELVQANKQLEQETNERKQAKKELDNSEKRFKELAELLPQAVFETDIFMNLTYANRQAFQLFGYTRQDFENGLNGISLIVPEDRERAQKNIVKRMRGEEFSYSEYFALKKDGSTFPILMHTSPIIEQDTVKGLRGVITDMTELKKAEAVLKKSQ